MSTRRTIYTLLLLMVAAFGHAQSYHIQCEDTCGHVHGIDMSHYQTKIFWDEVGDNNRIHYLYLKASEGSDNIDKRYQENIRMAQSHNIKVGSYHFYRPLRPQMEQLRNFRAQCRPEDQDLIPMIDVETKSGMRTEAFVDSLQKFLKLIEREYHQKPLIYTGQNFYNSYLVGALDGYKLMIAKYSDKEPVLSDDRDIFAWQYTGKGHLTGVNGYVDKSRLMGRHALREIRFHK